MDHDNESISIDLTEDEGDNQPEVQFVNCNDLNMYESREILASQDTKQSYNKLQKVRPSESTVQSSRILDIPKVSALNFIENLQKDNPQIETVFLDSDEGDNIKNDKSPSVKIHDMVIIKSPEKTNRYVNKSSLSNVENTLQATITSKTTIPANKTSVQKNEGVPFTVRAISPSRFNEKFANTEAHTIVLQNEADTSLKQFLVIPKEIAPLLVNSQGPITLNVPGLGPLLIPKPSDIFVSQPVPALVHTNKPDQEQGHRKVILKNINKPVYEPLSDLKYCWRYQRHRKRDLEGFTMSDRLGFYKAEQQRSKMCAAKYYNITKKLHMSIRRKEVALAAIRSSQLKIENIKLVEIDSIRKGKTSLLHNTQHGKSKMSPLILKGKNMFSSSIHCVPSTQSLSSESDSQIGNDLLVTKKVVFIDDTTVTAHSRGRKRKKRQGQFINQQTQKRNQSDLESLKSEISCQTVSSNGKEKTKFKGKSDILLIKSNKSGRPRGRPRKKQHMIKDDPLSDSNTLHSASIKLNTQDTKHKKLKARNYKYKDPKNHILPVRYSKSESSKVSVTKIKKQLSHVKNYDIKQCQVEITHNSLVEEAVEKYNDYTFECIKELVNSCKIIQNLTDFQDEIQPIKPILIINEDHCASVNFKEVFCKYNIVFPMLEITRFLNLNITNVLFVESAKKGYIKFVHPRVLSSYLAGIRGPPREQL